MTPEQLENIRRDARAEPENPCLQALAIKAEIKAGERPLKEPGTRTLVLVLTQALLGKGLGKGTTRAHIAESTRGEINSNPVYITVCGMMYFGKDKPTVGKPGEITCEDCELAWFAHRLGRSLHRRWPDIRCLPQWEDFTPLLENPGEAP